MDERWQHQVMHQGHESATSLSYSAVASDKMDPASHVPQEGLWAKQVSATASAWLPIDPWSGSLGAVAPGQGGAKAVSPPSSHSPALRLRGLPFQVTEADVRQWFAKDGFQVVEIHLMRRGGRPTGEALCFFASAQDAARACKDKDKQSMGNRYIELFHVPASHGNQAQRQAHPASQSAPAGLHITDMPAPPLPGGQASGGGAGASHSSASLWPGQYSLYSYGASLPYGDSAAKGSAARAAPSAPAAQPRSNSSSVGSASSAASSSHAFSAPPLPPSSNVLGAGAATGIMQQRAQTLGFGMTFAERMKEQATQQQLQRQQSGRGKEHSMSGGVSMGSSPAGSLRGAWAPSQMGAANSQTAQGGQAHGYSTSPPGAASGADGAGSLVSRPGEIVVRIRGLPFSAEDKDIKLFFEGLRISNMLFVLNHNVKPTGEAYVQFMPEVNLQAVLSFHKQKMGKRYIEIFKSNIADMAESWRAVQKLKAVRAMSQPVSRQSPALSMHEDAASDHSMPESHKGSADHQMGLGMDRGKKAKSFHGVCDGTVLKLRGLPYTAVEDDIIGFFGGFDLEDRAKSVSIVTRAEKEGRVGTCSGVAYVKFKSAEEAERARDDRHKKMMGNRYIECMTYIPKKDLNRPILKMGGSDEGTAMEQPVLSSSAEDVIQEAGFTVKHPSQHLGLDQSWNMAADVHENGFMSQLSQQLGQQLQWIGLTDSAEEPLAQQYLQPQENVSMSTAEDKQPMPENLSSSLGLGTLGSSWINSENIAQSQVEADSTAMDMSSWAKMFEGQNDRQLLSELANGANGEAANSGHVNAGQMSGW